MKSKQHHSGFEIRLLTLVPTTITATSEAPPIMYIGVEYIDMSMWVYLRKLSVCTQIFSKLAEFDTKPLV